MTLGTEDLGQVFNPAFPEQVLLAADPQLCWIFKLPWNQAGFAGQRGLLAVYPFLSAAHFRPQLATHKDAKGSITL